MPDPIPSVDLSALARDIAIEFLRLPDILKAHEVSDEQWVEISRDPQFLAMAAQLKRDWQATTNTEERVRLKAASAVEALMPQMLGIIVDHTVPASQRNDVYKTMMKLGRLAETSQDMVPTGERFVFNLNLAPGIVPTLSVDTGARQIEGEVVKP